MSQNSQPLISRRSFALGLTGAAAMVAFGGVVEVVGSEPICRPPGGQDEDNFIANCLRCEKCREVCPNGVIVPARLEQGILNARTPSFNFKLGWCDYCQESFDGVPQCVQVCPTVALRLPADATPESVILGKAYLVKDWCLGWQLMGCRRCYDECPYEAIKLDEYDRPFVVTDVCNGCGKCELVCISMAGGSLTTGATTRAITIKPSSKVEQLIAAEQRGGGRMKKKLSAGALRTITILLVGLIIIVGLVTSGGIGNLSAFGYQTIAAICPLGFLETLLASKLLAPRALIAFLGVVLLIVVLGRVLCAWICPVPLLQRWFPGWSKKKDPTKEIAQSATEDTAIDCQGHDCKSCGTGAKTLCGHTKPNNFKLDSRHAVLGGSLLSAAIFGFPVFCLICPVGLTFATILVIMRLFSFGDTTISLLVFPAILILELVVLRKWCSKICPLGAMVSLVAGANRFFKPSIDDSKCLVTAKGIDCSACKTACVREEIDLRRTNASPGAMSSCTKCRECADACPVDAIRFPLLQPRTTILKSKES